MRRELCTVLFVTAALLSAPLAASKTSAAEIPSPESVLGFVPGADRELMDYEQLVDYLQQLAAASPRITMLEVGSTPLGRPMYVVFLSAPENLERLDELRAINKRLALDAEIPPPERVELVRDGRVFVMETLSMHSGEVAPSQSLALFAFKVATADDAAILAGLDDVVLMIVPCHNPDGMDMVVEHYRKYVGTKYEGSSLPGVYHKYVGHDNNRDFVALTQEDTRVISGLYSTEWYPQVMVEKHQMMADGPRYFVPPNHDPIAQNIDEGLWNWSAVFGSNLSRDMSADGLRGVASHWLFDDYWPGSTETSLWKNVISFLTEAASCRTATPVFVEPTELRVRGKGLSEYKKGVNMPDPWPGGAWRLGDIVSYELSSMSSILATASRHRADILRFRNDLCRKEVLKGRQEAPYYYVLPGAQRDPGELGALVVLLQRHGVRVGRLAKDTVVGELYLNAGDVVIPMSQPYRAFIKEVMEKQRYPERHYTPDGDLIRPYDITSWSLPLHMGVRSIEVNTRSSELESLLEPPGSAALSVTADLPDDFWAVVYPSTSNASYRAVFAALEAGLEVSRVTQPFGPEGDRLPAGSFLILAGHAPHRALREIVSRVPVPPRVLDAEVTVETLSVRRPRIALVETWFHDMDAGWTRYLFDSFGIRYSVLHPEDFDSAELARDFDVVVFPSVGKDVLLKGKYKRGDRYMPSDYPPQFRKPISKKGLGKLTAFIEEGGAIVSWGRSTALFTEGLAALPNEGEAGENGGKAVEGEKGETVELPVRDVSKDLQSKGLIVPGAFLAVDFLPNHPVTWGMPERGGVFSRGAPVFATSIPRLDTDRRVIAVYPERDLLLSGYLDGEKLLQGRPAAVWIRSGKGQLVLFGFGPQFRGSVPATFKLVFNALLLPSVSGG
ncbi:MAG: M14 family zinc carboxypeptidase [Thermoanaerobaculales bacterium]